MQLVLLVLLHIVFIQCWG